MRKQTKLVAVLSAAALLAIGASMTSMAATGWTQQDGQWYYVDNSGDYVYDQWKKSGNSYFYLGDDGAMMTNALIQDGDNYYYVDANGAMVKSQWIQIAADDSEDQDVEYRWYYFGSTGRAYRATSNFTKKTINGKKYAFDSEGKMLFGFVTDDGVMTNQDTDPVLNAQYYFGSNEDGAMYTGWLNYTEGVDDSEYDGEDSLWFYYNPSNGQKQVNKTDKKINGYYYTFDSYGVMKTDWQSATNNTGATVSKYYNGDDQGWLEKKSWVWAVPSEEIDAITGSTDNDDDQYRWFYVGSDGKTTVSTSKRINGKWYMFDEAGRMKSGLLELNAPKINDATEVVKAFDSDEDDVDAVYAVKSGDLYYFGDEETDGAMKTGSSVKVEMADDTYTMGFYKTGKAYAGVENNKLYRNGVLQTAGDMRYKAIRYEGKVYVVGTTGTIVKAKNVAKDADDNYFAVTKDGAVYFVEAADEAATVARGIAQGKTSVKYDGQEYKMADYDAIPVEGDEGEIDM